MKKYIIMTRDIHSFGNLQILISKKVKYLENKDWQVYIFFAGKPFGQSEIPSLTRFISNCGFEDLELLPYKIASRRLDENLNSMKKILRIDQTIDNEIIIESHYSVGSCWAELLAERIQARHFFMPIDDFRNNCYLENMEFFYFKFLRQEIIPFETADILNYENSLQIMKEQAESELKYFTRKFKTDLRRFYIALFPFHLVEQNSKIVLYGENETSLDYQKQIGNYCQLVAIVADDYKRFDQTILPPEKLIELDYDQIVIAEKPNKQRLDEITQNIIRITGKNNFAYHFYTLGY